MKGNSMREMIDITGLDKAEVLAALFNRSKQQGMGRFDTSGAVDMSVDEAREIVASDSKIRLDFDCLRGRVMKVDITEDFFFPDLYDRDNGDGAAKAAIDSLRQRASA